MTGFFSINPLNFWLQFLISELVGYFSAQTKEGMTMVYKFFNNFKNTVILRSAHVHIAHEYHPPYRFNLLMIQCKSGEKA